MATYTYIALVVGFFALAFGFGFIAGVAHELDVRWVRPIAEYLNEIEKQSPSELRKKLYQEWNDNPFIPLDLTPTDWSEPEQDAIIIANWDIRKAEDALIKGDVNFESSFNSFRNRHQIKMPKDSLALLDGIKVKYELITEKE